jgi:hypothetical protein
MALDVNGTAYVGTRAGVLLAIGPRACSTCSLPARDVKSLLHLYPRAAHAGSTFVSRAAPHTMPGFYVLVHAVPSCRSLQSSHWPPWPYACVGHNCGVPRRLALPVRCRGRVVPTPEKRQARGACVQSQHAHSPAYSSHCLAPIACHPAFPCACVCVCVCVMLPAHGLLLLPTHSDHGSRDDKARGGPQRWGGVPTHGRSHCDQGEKRPHAIV